MPDSTSTTRRPAWVIPAMIVLVAAVLISISLLRGGGDAAGGAAGSGVASDARAADPVPTDGPVGEVIEPDAAATLEMARRDPQDPLVAGPVDAPVVLVVYSDYQCPFCALWVQDSQPTVMEYVAAGDLRIEWRDVNVYGPDSTRAAQAAYAAGLQGKFWEYHDSLFADGEKREPRELSAEALIALAEGLGLDVAQFTADLSSPDVAAAVQTNADEGAAIGAFSTPSFLIGGHPVVGAQPTGTFVDAVESALAEARG
ncbi:MAG: thioredoxin domain-containing protein [Actinomycetales bacterium]|nr:thioredoxin domain-containing protein [Actinomycetales bacterium]